MKKEREKEIHELSIKDSLKALREMEAKTPDTPAIKKFKKHLKGFRFK